MIFVTMPFSLDNAIALLVLNALSMLDVAVAPLLAAVPKPLAHAFPALSRLSPALLSLSSFVVVLLSVFHTAVEYSFAIAPEPLWSDCAVAVWSTELASPVRVLVGFAPTCVEKPKASASALASRLRFMASSTDR
ncbi:hypothetical protein [Thauera sp. 63]|uniref:hypothetical protein n=1 Tax=Thauera sp. 63 TaxID=497321 RepID=UPI0012F9C071|nr:hypothetical protein [Thauera sp. 63]